MCMATPGAPPLREVAHPTSRDRRPLSALLANLTPERLSGILRESESGQMARYMDLCDRMIETDAEVRADYETRIGAVSGARTQVEPGRCGVPERDALAAEGAAFVENVIANCRDFDQACTDLLDGIGKGYSVLQREWVWEHDAFVVRSFDWIHQRRFEIDSRFTLRLVDDGESVVAGGVELDPDLFIIHAPRSVAGYQTRAGCLRAVAWPYLFKRWGQQFWVQGAEAFAWPFLFAKVPRNAPADVRQKALDGLDALSADHRAVLEDPTAIELIETTVKDGGTWKDLAAGMNAEIAKAILGMTDLSGPGKVGAYGAVESRRGATVAARIALDERALAGTMQDQFAEALMRFNAHRWGGVIPAIPSIRRVVATSRMEIPTAQLPASRVDEVRASMDQAPIGGAIGAMLWRDFAAGSSLVASVSSAVDVATPAGDGAVQDAAPNGAQLASLQAFLSAVQAGALAPGAAKVLIGKTFSAFFDATEVATMVDEQYAARVQSVPVIGA